MKINSHSLCANIKTHKAPTMTESIFLFSTMRGEECLRTTKHRQLNKFTSCFTSLTHIHTHSLSLCVKNDQNVQSNNVNIYIFYLTLIV